MTHRKIIAFFLALLALCLTSAQNVKTVGGVARANVKTVGGVAIASVKSVGGVDNTGGGATYDLEEGFEPAGYTLTWTEAGAVTPNEDATANLFSGNGLNQYLNLAASAQTCSTFTSFPAGHDNVYVYFRMRVNSWGASSQEFCTIRTSGASVRGTLQLTAARVMRVLNSGGTLNASTDAISTGVGNEIHVWFEYELGGGANAVCRAGWSTDGTKPTLTAGAAKACASTDGTGVAQTQRLYIGSLSSQTWDIDIDVVKINFTTPIGSNP